MPPPTKPSRGHYEQRTWRPDGDYGVGRRHRVAQRIDCYVPDRIATWDPPLTGSVAAALSEADLAVRELNADAPDFAGIESLSRQLLRQESVGSSRIEGLQMGQRRLARAASGLTIDETASQIVANIRAMEDAIGRASENRPLALNDIIDVHKTLLGATRDAHLAGVVRTDQNWVGGSAFSPSGAEFIPPPENHVEGLLADLVEFLNRDDLPATQQAAIAHAQFESIHPFADGNGRVGRCLIHVVYRRRGLAPTMVPPISLVLATRSDDYIGGLDEFRYYDQAEWALFFAIVTIASVRRARALGSRIEELRAKWLTEMGNPRSDASVRRIVERLPAEPLVSINRATEIAGVSRPAAAKAIDALVVAGVLKQLGRRERGRTWEAPEVFDLLDAFERELATPEGDERPVRPAPRR